MAKWQRLAGGKDPGGANFQEMCDRFSSLAGVGIRYERHGDEITLYTDGDPDEVLSILIGASILYEALDVIEQEMRLESNARLN